MDGKYTIDLVPEHDLVRVRMSGFYDRETIAAFVVQLRAAHKRLRCGPNQFVTVNDVRDMKIQSQDIVDAFRDMLSDPIIRSRRLAFVVASTLARMQLMRVIAHRDAACFLDAEEAEEWLLRTTVDSG